MKYKLKFSINTEMDEEYDGVEYDSLESAERAGLRALYEERERYGDKFFIIWIEEV